MRFVAAGTGPTMEHDEQAERMEHQADHMEHDSEQVGDQIDETRRDWEAKEQDPRVPGAQPEDPDEERSIPGVEADEEILREEPGP